MAVPSKIFEYLTFDAWILALANPGSATELVLRGTGASVVAADDHVGIFEALKTNFEQFRAGVRPPSVDPAGPLSRRAQAEILFDAIEAVV